MLVANKGPGDITPDAEIKITIAANARISSISFHIFSGIGVKKASS